MKHHTKAARRRAFRAYHTALAQEAMAAHAGRCLAAFLLASARVASGDAVWFNARAAYGIASW